MTKKILIIGEYENKPAIFVHNNNGSDEELKFTIIEDDLEFVEKILETEVHVFEYNSLDKFHGSMRVHAPEKFFDKYYETTLNKNMINLIDAYDPNKERK